MQGRFPGKQETNINCGYQSSVKEQKQVAEPNANQSLDGQTSTSGNSLAWMTAALIKQSWLNINPATE